jgi:hypothetical protein
MFLNAGEWNYYYKVYDTIQEWLATVPLRQSKYLRK